ncbi:unnamed protein product [Vitrella brassicaformis CCMP3155]|uniref:Uncharacterized protein n=1 Tax=Vitrella brassicaformis (strain CCMP3155) TaxID=1169540 RepID=A0A0G4FYY8_VITBC|nr:unnamed protein product [Vitrella brassicaformis CCMP3155]|eukprot:CEM20835.1 unnamed protein product [Vitrella brassicaformis CCMP3155]
MEAEEGDKGNGAELVWEEQRWSWVRVRPPVGLSHSVIDGRGHPADPLVTRQSTGEAIRQTHAIHGGHYWGYRVYFIAQFWAIPRPLFPPLYPTPTQSIVTSTSAAPPHSQPSQSSPESPEGVTLPATAPLILSHQLTETIGW